MSRRKLWKQPLFEKIKIKKIKTWFVSGFFSVYFFLVFICFFNCCFSQYRYWILSGFSLQLLQERGLKCLLLGCIEQNSKDQYCKARDIYFDHLDFFFLLLRELLLDWKIGRLSFCRWGFFDLQLHHLHWERPWRHLAGREIRVCFLR